MPEVEKPKLTFKPVTKATWKDFEALFEAKGGPGYCWCMPFREIATADRSNNAAKKEAMKARVAKRVPIGLVGYFNGEPVAWCSVGPRESFRAGLTDDYDPEEAGVWSVTCFFVRKELRGQGLTEAMLEAAVAYARKRGAKVVEGYPVAESSPSYRFMGFLPLFRKAGFTKVGSAGSRRSVVRKEA